MLKSAQDAYKVLCQMVCSFNRLAIIGASRKSSIDNEIPMTHGLCVPLLPSPGLWESKRQLPCVWGDQRQIELASRAKSFDFTFSQRNDNTTLVRVLTCFISMFCITCVTYEYYSLFSFMCLLSISMLFNMCWPVLTCVWPVCSLLCNLWPIVYPLILLTS